MKCDFINPVIGIIGNINIAFFIHHHIIGGHSRRCSGPAIAAVGSSTIAGYRGENSGSIYFPYMIIIILYNIHTSNGICTNL